MALHLVPLGEPHEFGVGCPCRPLAGERVVKGRAVPVVEHRSARGRWLGAQATSRTREQPAEGDRDA